MRRSSAVGLIFGCFTALWLVGSADAPLPAGFVSAYHWKGDDPLFGGFSSIDVTADGNSYLAITDRGSFTSGTINRDETGRIQALTQHPMQTLMAETGGLFAKNWNDSEGLALLPDGTVFISFERRTRVLRYDTLHSRPVSLPVPPQMAAMPRNTGPEALAVDAAGRLYTMAEKPSDRRGTFPVLRFADGVWKQAFLLPRRGSYLAVGADFGPDGCLYVLERQFYGPRGFASRVRRFTLSGTAPLLEETLLESQPGQHDNLEGLSVWRDRTGALRLTMISDDNFFVLQRTEVVEYRVPG